MYRPPQHNLPYLQSRTSAGMHYILLTNPEWLQQRIPYHRCFLVIKSVHA